MQEYFTALFITLAVEYIIYLIFIRTKPLQILFYAILINCLTHPIAYFVYSQLIDNYSIASFFNIYFFIIEIIVFLTEIFLVMLLFKIKFKKAVLISFTANLVTAVLSFVI